MQHLPLLAYGDGDVAGQKLCLGGQGAGRTRIFVEGDGRGIGDRPGPGDAGRHPAEGVLGELELGDRLSELIAIYHVARGLFERSLGQSAGASTGLETPGTKARHLQIETPVELGFAAY